MAQKFNHPFGTGGRSVSKPPMAKPMGGEAMEPAGEDQDGATVASEHGPATEVHMTHDHDMGVHSVASTHPDGHTHESQHGSAEEAHEHGKKLAGVGAEESHDEEEGDEPWGDE